MDGYFREMWEETAVLPSLKRETRVEKRFFNRIKITESRLHDPEGLCYTLEFRDELFNNEELKEELIKELSVIIARYFDKYGIERGCSVLVAALGNDKVTADSLGTSVADKLLVTSHLYSDKKIADKFGKLSCLKCGVSGTTGISSFDVLKSVVSKTEPEIVIAIDALACGSTARLAHTVQLTDRGIEPGGGVGNARPELTEESLGVPVIAIGVPFVMYVRKILAEFCPDSTLNLTSASGNLIVTGREIDFQVSDFSHVIAEAINRAVHN